MFKHLFALSLIFSATSFANDSIDASLSSDSILLDITSLSSNQYIAVGERGHILIGTSAVDAKQILVPTRATLTAVTRIDNLLWAVGHDFTIVHSSDSGATWEVQYQDVEKEHPLMDVHFFDPQNGIVAGAYGSFMRTSDGGKTWTTELHSTLLHPDDIEYLEEVREFDGEEFYKQELESILPHFNRLYVFDNTVYMAGESGMLAKSINEGRSWERIDIEYDGSFFDITLSKDILFAGGLRGNLFMRHTNKDWVRIDLCHTGSVNSLLVVDEQLLVLSNNGYVATIDYLSLDESPDCDDPQVSVKQNSDKVTLLNALSINNNMIAVTSNGLAQLTE